MQTDQLQQLETVRNRLRTLAPSLYCLSLALLGLLAAGCDGTGPDQLPEYEGHRALEVLQVTQSYTPDLQWVGGRVAAVGVNRGSTAALDSTLIWIATADDNSIPSHVTISGEANQRSVVESYGGTPADSLASGEQYTFWLAEKSVFEAGLDSSSFDGMNFVDTTFTTQLQLTGLTKGEFGLVEEITVTRDQSLLEERYIVNWTPSSIAFRRIAIQVGTTGGFDNLVWHVLVPEESTEGILPPVVIGEAPENTEVAVEFTGFVSGEGHTLWMNTSEWEGNFGFGATGYAAYQMFESNF